jgi:pheromone shutdown protein TraB
LKKIEREKKEIIDKGFKNKINIITKTNLYIFIFCFVLVRKERERNKLFHVIKLFSIVNLGSIIIGIIN